MLMKIHVNLTQTTSDRLSELRHGMEAAFRPLHLEHPQDVRLALNEAEAIAWQTGVPHLVFPALAEEKLESVTRWHRRQQALRERDPLLSFAA